MKESGPDQEQEKAKAYDPLAVEGEIYGLWEASGFFNPDNLPPLRSLGASRGKPGRRTKPFTIIMPPPNANGALHIGHAVFATLQDIMIRFQRMRGKKALWLPGADHAGFETQVVFEKKLEKEGRNRFEIPRDQLWREMWEFTMESKKIMEAQLRKLGASCDWSREKFTLDPDVVRTVTDTFRALYEDRLIYRGERIVNWCPKHQTSLSDLETKYVEKNDPLFYIKYGPLTLATVRPETKFGDTAVAVHPKDKRYQKYVGKEIEIETLLGSVKIKVIADSAIDPEFGTGVVKVTPAHDPADFEIGKRHNLEVREVIDRFGRLNEKTGPYAGLKVAEAREKVAADMQARGLLEKIDPSYVHNVAVCYKCGTVVEPRVMPQWFVRMTESLKKGKKSLRDMAVAAVKSNKIKFFPKSSEKVFFHWMKNLRDWNISRQIVWGIRIPAWFCVGCGGIRVEPKIKGNWYFVRHGETDWNVEHRLQGHSYAPLNERGKEQASRAARQLEDKNIDLILSSDLPRARQTAEIIGKELGIEVVLDRELRERHHGIFDGKLMSEIDPEAPWLRKNNEAPEGGESLDDLENRIYRAISKHKSDHSHKNIVIVSHGGALKWLLRLLRNTPHERMREFKIGNAEILPFAVSDECHRCKTDFIEQDPDVLDTWFSSGQWPFAALGYPKGKDYKTFYPTGVMETGVDILFFWVARMIMFGLYRTGKVPFKTVYLHGLVRDKDRKKMSKSKGNVIDPLGIAEQYGTDAVRFALVVGNLPGQDIIISEEKIRGYRNFANKLWNIQRFISMKVANGTKGAKKAKAMYRAGDKKRLAELKAIVKRVTNDIESFRFHHAAETLYHYVWHTFADKIIEEAKPRLDPSNPDSKDRAAARALLLEIHRTNLKLLHPFMPFITEKLWQELNGAAKDAKAAKDTKDLLMIEPWPVKRP